MKLDQSHQITQNKQEQPSLCHRKFLFPFLMHFEQLSFDLYGIQLLDDQIICLLAQYSVHQLRPKSVPLYL